MTNLKFSTGYSDCATCLGAGGVFGEEDLYISCPECDRRDEQFEEMNGLVDDGFLVEKNTSFWRDQ